ncbi:hypothetical protein [Streptomyces sp. NPDC000880]
MTWVPEVCTLPTEEQPLRVAEFDGLFADALQRIERVEPGRLRLVLDGTAEERARELAQRESSCCSFFTFSLDRDSSRRALMDVAVPAEHTAVLDALAVRAAAAAAKRAS